MKNLNGLCEGFQDLMKNLGALFGVFPHFLPNILISFTHGEQDKTDTQYVVASQRQTLIDKKNSKTLSFPKRGMGGHGLLQA